MTGPVEWLGQALKTAEEDARYTDAGFVFFDVSDDAVVDHYQGAGSPEAALRLAAGARQILAEHAADDGECLVCSASMDIYGAEVLGHVPWPCRTVRLLAEAWGWEEKA